VLKFLKMKSQKRDRDLEGKCCKHQKMSEGDHRGLEIIQERPIELRVAKKDDCRPMAQKEKRFQFPVASVQGGEDLCNGEAVASGGKHHTMCRKVKKAQDIKGRLVDLTPKRKRTRGSELEVSDSNLQVKKPTVKD